MGRCVIPGVCEKNGSFYRRFKVRQGDRWKDLYVPLPHPTDSDFAPELERVNASHKSGGRSGAAAGSIAALAAEFRAALANGWTRKTRKKGTKPLADSTMRNYLRYVAMIEKEHGHRLVRDMRPAHVYRIRDGMGATPGKANNYLNVLKLMMAFACQRDWRDTNPAQEVPLLPIGEHEPWPQDVLQRALQEATPMLRLAIITGLCTGQRVSDCIRIQHGWLKGGIMQLSQIKTDVDVAVPIHALWRQEIARVERRAVTVLYDRAGRPFQSEDRIQERIRRLMHDIGQVDDRGQLLYTFHGLRKNACCYLLELGLSDTVVGAILGMTPETVRHYGKRARTLMLAQTAAATIACGKMLPDMWEKNKPATKKPL